MTDAEHSSTKPAARAHTSAQTAPRSHPDVPVPVPLDAVLPLRHAVLRPGLPESQSQYPADREPDTVHLAVLDDDAVVACGTFLPEPYPAADAWPLRFPADPATTWRVRGMATDPRRRGQGFGTSVLAAGIEHVRQAGGSLLWCNARVGAWNLYQRAGFEAVGTEFELPGIGPHRRAVLRLPS